MVLVDQARTNVTESTKVVQAVTRNNRRRFRFSLRTFLAIPPLFAVVLSFWITWPQRTASKFAQALQLRDGTVAGEMCPDNDVLNYYGLLQDNSPLQCTVSPKHRPFQDVLLGRGSFVITVVFKEQIRWGKPYQMSIEVQVDKGTLSLIDLGIYSQSISGRTSIPDAFSANKAYLAGYLPHQPAGTCSLPSLAAGGHIDLR
jgi:hypothetical protein